MAVASNDCPGAAQASRSVAPPPATQLRVDMRNAAPGVDGAPFFFVRVQAHVRARYPILEVESTTRDWHITIGRPLNASAEQSTAAVRPTYPHSTGVTSVCMRP